MDMEPPSSGPRGRWFESTRPDQSFQIGGTVRLSVRFLGGDLVAGALHWPAPLVNPVESEPGIDFAPFAPAWSTPRGSPPM